MTIFKKKMKDPFYYIARSLRIRRFVLNCLPVFVLVEFFIIAIFMMLVK